MRLSHTLAALAALLALLPAHARQAAPAGALNRLPVREVTVFKDGHAFVLHEGKLPVDATGAIQMDYLPTPVMGTFWPYVDDRDTRLAAVVASPRRVTIEGTALTTQQLLLANPGAEVSITDVRDKVVTGTIVGIPTRTPEELLATSPPNTPEPLPEIGGIILVRTAEGVVALPLDQVRSVAFRSEYKTRFTSETFRNLLTLKLSGNAASRQVTTGLMYLQKGFRWIPSYRITLDGKGGAVVTLQATLINELTDLDDVTLNLVVGVPSFAFKDTLDPMALQQTLANLGAYFQSDSRQAFGFSNALLSQTARMDETRIGAAGRPARQPAPPPDLGPEIGGTEQAEDLFMQTVRHITLKRGQRMLVPVAEFRVKYRDVYTLDVPAVPPAGLRRNVGTDQEEQLARLLAAPKPVHKVRLTNDTKQPFTTAPALIMMANRPLAQGMMTYTSAGGTTDLEITAAIDIKVQVASKETGRTPDVATWQTHRLGRIDLAGTITLTNYRKEAVEVEVTRSIVGHVGTVGQGGKADMVDLWGDRPEDAARPAWWSWYPWPAWWAHVNGMGRFTWTVKLDPGKSVDLTYTWNYLWE